MTVKWKRNEKMKVKGKKEEVKRLFGPRGGEEYPVGVGGGRTAEWSRLCQNVSKKLPLLNGYVHPFVVSESV